MSAAQDASRLPFVMFSFHLNSEQSMIRLGSPITDIPKTSSSQHPYSAQEDTGLTPMEFNCEKMHGRRDGNS